MKSPKIKDRNSESFLVLYFERKNFEINVSVPL